jgi:hypothetical protein
LPPWQGVQPNFSGSWIFSNSGWDGWRKPRCRPWPPCRQRHRLARAQMAGFAAVHQIDILDVDLADADVEARQLVRKPESSTTALASEIRS